MKKIVGIIICILFLFSTFPIVDSTDSDKTNIESSLHKTDSSIQGFAFGMLYGSIINNGIEYSGLYLVYNLSAINVNGIYLYWDKDDPYLNEFHFGRVYEEGEIFYEPLINFLFHPGFVTKNYIFWIGFEVWF
jgi:hypothetical protein